MVLEAMVLVGVEIVVGLKGDFLYVVRQFLIRVCRRVRCHRSFASFLPLFVSHVFKVFIDPFLS